MKKFKFNPTTLEGQAKILNLLAKEGIQGLIERQNRKITHVVCLTNNIKGANNVLFSKINTDE